jgi:hypothetical protein
MRWEFEDSTIVGGFLRRRMGETLLKTWTDEKFGALFGYILRCMVLMKGCLVWMFRVVEDGDNWILRN